MPDDNILMAGGMLLMLAGNQVCSEAANVSLEQNKMDLLPAYYRL